MTICFGKVEIEIRDDFTVTRLPNGSVVIADHSEQAGQAAQAHELGYATAEEMNRDHDLTHSVLAHLLGLECSPTLLGVASGAHFAHWRQEEAAVLRFQGYARLVGVDIMKFAERLATRRSTS